MANRLFVDVHTLTIRVPIDREGEKRKWFTEQNQEIVDYIKVWHGAALEVHREGKFTKPDQPMVVIWDPDPALAEEWADRVFGGKMEVSSMAMDPLAPDDYDMVLSGFSPATAGQWIHPAAILGPVMWTMN